MMQNNSMNKTQRFLLSLVKMSTNDELYLISENTGDRFRLNGCRRSSTTNSVPRFGSSRLNSRSQRRFPPSVDLRRNMTPVENQGNLKSWSLSFSLFSFLFSLFTFEFNLI